MRGYYTPDLALYKTCFEESDTVRGQGLWALLEERELVCIRGSE